MSLSTRVKGYRDPGLDGEYSKMLEVYEVCKKHGIALPKEVSDFFGGDPPECALEVDIKFDLSRTEGSKRYDVLVENIPKGVYKIRFENSW